MKELTLDYFMWGYQHCFQGSAEYSAQRLFSKLVPESNPRLFLVGCLKHDRDDRLPVCVEPDFGPIQPECFHDLEQRMTSIAADDEESAVCISHPVAAERVRSRLFGKHLGRAIEECCTYAGSENSYHYFASNPTEVDSYDVCVVLRLNAEPFKQFHSFTDRVIDRVPVVTSFVDAVIKEFLAECQIALREPNAGENLCVVKAGPDELHRRAGVNFMKSVAMRAFGDSAFSRDGLGHVEQLCEAMTSVAAMKHEGDDAIGRIVVCNPTDLSIQFLVQLETPVLLTNKRRVRKLLELAGSDWSLILADSGIIGVGRPTTGDGGGGVFTIHVLGHHWWRVSFQGRSLCEFRFGLPEMARPKIELANFSEHCDRVIGDAADTESLWNILQGCIAQPHGTTLVISSRAEEEGLRLSKQSTPIMPKRLDADAAVSVSAIDGAVLVDGSGVCYSIGVILDGLATDAGDPGRGARFNSAIRYLNSHGPGCIVCVVSEDGDVALLPQLRKRVRRSFVDDAVAALVEYCHGSELKPREFASYRNAIAKLRFYLTAEHCALVNQAIKKAEHSDEGPSDDVKFIIPEFVPHPEMNSSFWAAE